MKSENISKVINEIKVLANNLPHNVKIMEVCGTHTVSIKRSGLEDLLPDNIELISGPGCPVCVTPSSFIGECFYLLNNSDITIYTFGDMLKVPYKNENLASFRDRVKIMYSPLDVLNDNSNNIKVVLGIGFETTVPLFAKLAVEVKKSSRQDIFLLTSFKAIMPALKYLVNMNDVSIDGFILPGHVSAIVGKNFYKELFNNIAIPGCIAGFSDKQILFSIYYILKNYGIGICGNVYSEVVPENGNPVAKEITSKVFDLDACHWRGLGELDKSSYSLNGNYDFLDAREGFSIPSIVEDYNSNCRCADVITGKIKPVECSSYLTVCNPENPLGPCMVSSEGACAAFYKYSNLEK